MLQRLLSRFQRQPTVKPLSLIDATCGMNFEMQTQQARAALIAAEMSHKSYIENLRLRYHAPEGKWLLQDWAIGFVPVGDDDAENT